MAIQFKHRVLIVDDDSGIRNITSMVLEVNNYDVAAAENGIEAIPLLKNKRPHVLISDLRMPYMDGYELLHLARRFFPDMGAIILSGFDGGRVPGNELADAVFAKGDYSVPDLLNCVSDLASRYPLREPGPRSLVSPSWISSEVGPTLWVACRECLGCFPLPLSEMEHTGMHREKCPSCSQNVRFMVPEDALDTMRIAA
jgi:CheY-like chemotaxis protein